MQEEQINIIDNLIEAISILNKTEEYLDSLVDKLSECDLKKSDYEHLIEGTPIEEVNLKELYLKMQENFNIRRIIKNNLVLRDNYRNLTARLNNATNREFLIQSMKNAQSKIGIKYHNRILTEEELKKIKEMKKGRGRPKKVKEGV